MSPNKLSLIVDVTLKYIQMIFFNIPLICNINYLRGQNEKKSLYGVLKGKCS